MALKPVERAKPMKESMPSRASAPERSAETLTALWERSERMLQSAETARQYWTEALALLEEGVPHDDFVVDQKTISFHVIRNTYLSHINELCEQIEVLQDTLASLKEMRRQEMH